MRSSSVQRQLPECSRVGKLTKGAEYASCESVIVPFADVYSKALHDRPEVASMKVKFIEVSAGGEVVAHTIMALQFTA